MNLLNKIVRNIQDYGLPVTLNKAVRYILSPIYFHQAYRIYKTGIRAHTIDSSIRLLTEQDTTLIRQIESENEFLHDILANYLCLVALDRETLAGFILIDFAIAEMPIVNHTEVLQANQAYLEHVSVSRQYRQSGLGRRLIQAALNELDKMEARELICGILPSNTKSIRMIESAGFKLVTDIKYRKLFLTESWA
jgi:ribosomal protein S18 acetylase RimI-like enzyme